MGSEHCLPHGACLRKRAEAERQGGRFRYPAESAGSCEGGERSLHLLIVRSRVLRRQHKNQVICVRKFGFNAGGTENFREQSAPGLPAAGISAGAGGVDDKFQGLAVQDRYTRFPQACLQSFDAGDSPGEPGFITVREVCIAEIQGLQDEVGGAGGREQRKSGPDFRPQQLHCRITDLQVSASGQDRESLVGGIASHKGAEIQRMQGFRKKMQVSPVGIVHKHRDFGVPDGFRDPADVCQRAEIVRTGQIDREGAAVHGAEPGRDLVRRRMAGTDRIQVCIFRPDPLDVAVQQRTGIEKGLVGVPGGENHRTGGRGCPGCGPGSERRICRGVKRTHGSRRHRPRVLQREEQHGADREA